ILKLATLYFSSEEPTVADVIPAIDKIDTFFTTRVWEMDTGPNESSLYDVSFALKVSLMCAKRTLNKYYALTDASSVYRIAMILHPQYKLSYFREQKWESEWINEAHRLTQEVYENRYHDRLDLLEAYRKKDTKAAESTNAKSFTARNMFVRKTASMSVEERNELDRFLSSDIEAVDD
ncbi:hypothetical protein V5O48_019496, partial [Marasmius crinis-equi]